MNSTTFKRRLVLLLVAATMSVVSYAQSISGNVKDAMGEPVIGATVMEKGTRNGAVTEE